ncbi:MAG: hypothetical protein CL662_05440 [Bacteroidetes bacterium]|nr:hypothetical protein [Bacteroidota bacterium]HCI71072.1 hypothetical protein [Balneola sp.]|tara:strand:- start:8610 stop:10208 length:1599 start_codon:yes stop_codon:yes gene_type:complete
MNKISTTILLILFIGLDSNAQAVYPVTSTFNSIRQNGVSNILGAGDTLWISPSLNFNVNNNIDWFQPSGIDSITNGEGRIFSMDISGSSIAVGLGFSIELDGDPIPSGFGFYVSGNNGINWLFKDFPLDDNPPDNCDDEAIPYTGECDIEYNYGGTSYFRIRNTVRQQSPPFDIQIQDNYIFTAAFGSGLLRSSNSGNSWEKVILPPSNVSILTPEQDYFWTSNYNGQTINRFDVRSDLNLRGFGLHIDSNNQVWYGSANGINISPDALSAPTDSISWKHINFNNNSNGLLGDWVIEIEEDPTTNTIWMTNWVIDGQRGERFGIVSTSDNGETFRQHLIGEKINSIGFKDGAIFAAGENGLFISTNGGNSWSKFPQIRSANTFLKESAEFLSVSSTTDRVWVGSDDGLASTDDLGQTWEITRVNFPLSGGNAFDPDAKTVQTYAYPNPFSPALHDIVRIKYELNENGTVKIRIFDFGMNQVREIENDTYSAGTYEAVWDGIDDYGRKVANAPYIYVIEMPDRTIDGKILVVE